jgi:hypothetical protein
VASLQRLDWVDSALAAQPGCRPLRYRMVCGAEVVKFAKTLVNLCKLTAHVS